MPDIELTLEDLRSTTWDFGSEEAIGTINGKTVCRYCFDLPGHPFQLVLRRCNVAEGWAEFAAFEDPLDMRRRMIHPCDKLPELRRDVYGHPVILRHRYTGPLVIYSRQGHTLFQIPA